MKILVVGGSNTAMRPGYVGDLNLKLKERADGNSYQVHSVALGANACTMGLEMLQGVDLTAYDVICIEYFINDTILLGAEQNRPTWFGAYIGLHKLIRKVNSSARIINLILCRRVLRGTESQMRTFVLEIAEQFGAEVVDVDAILRDTLPDDEFASLYSNNSHYEFGAATAKVADLVIEGILGSASEVNRSVLSSPIDYLSFENSQVISLHSASENPKNFKNSRYSIRTAPINYDKPLVVDVPGSLISVSFLSVPSSGTILIQEDGEQPILVDTAHKEVVSGRWTFLVQSVIFKNKTWKSSPQLLGAPRSVTFELISSDRRRELLHYLQPSSLIESPLAVQEGEAQLIGCMCYSDVEKLSNNAESGLTFVSGKVYQYDS